jgi:hypothetical protein
MRGTLRTAAAAVAAILVVLGACGDDDGGKLSVDLGTTTTAAASGATTTTLDPGIEDADAIPETATSLVNVPDELPDGTYFGYITTLLAGDTDISGQFDLAELLTGQAAVDAANDAGEEPLDFYIKNENKKLRPILVAPDAQVRDVDYDDCCDAKPTTIIEFIEDRDAKHEERTAVALTVKAGQVTAIREVFFP